MIGNGFNYLDINPTYQQIVEGSIILLAMGVDACSRPPDVGGRSKDEKAPC